MRNKLLVAFVAVAALAGCGGDDDSETTTQKAPAVATDLTPVKDYLLDHTSAPNNIVSNPPFDIFEAFTKHALERASHKVALIMPTARLNAARWLYDTPLQSVWLLTPRPSMPPGHVIRANGKVGGGKSDYCWLVFEHGYSSHPELKWLHRDKP